jgi:hypothetical protein
MERLGTWQFAIFWGVSVIVQAGTPLMQGHRPRP